MRIVSLLLAGVLLAGCASKPDHPNNEAAYLTEKPGALPADRTALRVAQQFAPGGLSNESRLLVLGDALARRNRAPSHTWSVEPTGGDTFLVKAKLTALERQDTEFQWTVDLSKPPQLVCKPANREAESLASLRVKLDETGLEDYLGPALKVTPKP